MKTSGPWVGEGRDCVMDCRLGAERGAGRRKLLTSNLQLHSVHWELALFNAYLCCIASVCPR